MNPFTPVRHGKAGPEAKIQVDLIKELRSYEWFVQVFVGNALQHGIPDLLAAKSGHGTKWIEVKYKPNFSFTKRQQEKFPQMQAAGIGIWVLFDSTPEELMKLTKPANWQEVFLNWSNNVYSTGGR